MPATSDVIEDDNLDNVFIQGKGLLTKLVTFNSLRTYTFFVHA